MSVERIARALEGIDASEKHTDECWRRQMHVGAINRCVCGRRERVRARQAAAVLEALQAAPREAIDAVVSCESPDCAKHQWARTEMLREAVEVGTAALERLAGSPRPQEETHG